MTAAADDLVDPVVEFRRHLPANAERSLRVTTTVVALVHAAVRNHGWTAKALAAECSRDLPADLANPGPRLEERLRKAATHPPPNKAAKRAVRHRHGCGGWTYLTPDDPAGDVQAVKCHGCATEETNT